MIKIMKKKFYLFSDPIFDVYSKNGKYFLEFSAIKGVKTEILKNDFEEISKFIDNSIFNSKLTVDEFVEKSSLSQNDLEDLFSSIYKIMSILLEKNKSEDLIWEFKLLYFKLRAIVKIVTYGKEKKFNLDNLFTNIKILLGL